jgi:hypothetical protein
MEHGRPARDGGGARDAPAATPRARADPLWRALAAAAALHAAVVASAPLLPDRGGPAAPALEVRGDLFDVEVAPAPADAPRALDERPGAPTPTAGAGGEHGAKVGIVAKAAEPRAPSATPPAAEPSPGPPSGPPNGDPVGDDGSPSEPVADEYGPPGGSPSGDPAGAGVPGLGGAPVWAVPGVVGLPAPAAPAPTEAAPAPEVPRDVATRVLSGSLRQRDQEIGVGVPSAAVVADALTLGVRATETPGDGRATFEVRLGADGSVLGVRVVSASAGGAGAWEQAARRAARALAGKPLAMHGTAAERGAVVTVKVESKVVYPAGTKKKVDVQPVCAEEVLQDMADAIDAAAHGQAPHGPIREPGATGEDPGLPRGGPTRDDRRFCIPIGIAAQLDPANLGAKPHRVVSSSAQVRVPGERLLSDPKLVDTRAPWMPADPNKAQLPAKKKKPKKKKDEKK